MPGSVVRGLLRRQAREPVPGRVPPVLEAAAEDRLLVKSHVESRCELPGIARSTYLMVFSPDGRKIASTHGNHSVYITDVKTGKNLNILAGHPRTPWCIAFHPSSTQILATGCLGGQVRVWDLHGGSEVWTARGETVIASLAFHPVDQVLVIATYNELYFWDWSKPAPFAKCHTANEKEKVRYVSFDKSGCRLVTGISNATAPVSQWDRGGPEEEWGRAIASHLRALLAHYERLLEQLAPRPAPVVDRGTDPMETDTGPSDARSSTAPGRPGSRERDTIVDCYNITREADEMVEQLRRQEDAAAGSSRGPGSSGSACAHGSQRSSGRVRRSETELASLRRSFVETVTILEEASQLRDERASAGSHRRRCISMLLESLKDNREHEDAGSSSDSSCDARTRAAVSDAEEPREPDDTGGETASGNSREYGCVSENLASILMPVCDTLEDEDEPNILLVQKAVRDYFETLIARLSNIVSTLSTDPVVLSSTIDDELILIKAYLSRMRTLYVKSSLIRDMPTCSQSSNSSRHSILYRIDKASNEISTLRSNKATNLSSRPTVFNSSLYEKLKKFFNQKTTDTNKFAQSGVSTLRDDTVVQDEENLVGAGSGSKGTSSSTFTYSSVEDNASLQSDVPVSGDTVVQAEENLVEAGSGSKGTSSSTFTFSSMEDNVSLQSDVPVSGDTVVQDEENNVEAGSGSKGTSSSTFTYSSMEDNVSLQSDVPVSGDTVVQAEENLVGAGSGFGMEGDGEPRPPTQSQTSGTATDGLAFSEYSATNASDSQDGNAVKQEHSFTGSELQETSSRHCTNMMVLDIHQKTESLIKSLNSARSAVKMMRASGSVPSSSSAPDASPVSGHDLRAQAMAADEDAAHLISKVCNWRSLSLGECRSAPSVDRAEMQRARSSFELSLISLEVRSATRRIHELVSAHGSRASSPSYWSGTVGAARLSVASAYDRLVRLRARIGTEDPSQLPESVMEQEMSELNTRISRWLASRPGNSSRPGPAGTGSSVAAFVQKSPSFVSKLSEIINDRLRTVSGEEGPGPARAHGETEEQPSERSHRGGWTYFPRRPRPEERFYVSPRSAFQPHVRRAESTGLGHVEQSIDRLSRNLDDTLRLCRAHLEELELQQLQQLWADLRAHVRSLQDRPGPAHRACGPARTQACLFKVSPNRASRIKRPSSSDRSRQPAASSQSSRSNPDQYRPFWTMMQHLESLVVRHNEQQQRFQHELAALRASSVRQHAPARDDLYELLQLALQITGVLLTRLVNSSRRVESSGREAREPREPRPFTVPAVRVNDVPVSDTAPRRAVRLSSPPRYQHLYGDHARPRFLHPRHVAWAEPDSPYLGPPVVLRDVSSPQTHRIQLWDFSQFCLPDISKADENVVVSECKIHNDASIDVSKDGFMLAALLPSDHYENFTNTLGVYSLLPESRGQCLYTTSLEQNAVSVSFSPTARHLLIGVAINRATLLSTDSNSLARVYRLSGSAGSVSRVRSFERTREHAYMSINCIRWLPAAGQGFVYGTNTGQLRILR
ncbi:uncharacterized protein LOC134535704 isoform X2 [Bacillus rossius redtenbacheri]|uniref:uncharacterized protein LOC134535704 isoform X2 n=1 Tax=Bacillus rossius redtenbacheri TaxID=93214 RepID=UPI002FDD8E7B